MKRFLPTLAAVLAMLLSPCVPAHAFWIWTPETGRWINPKYAIKDTPKKQLDYALTVYKSGDLDKARHEFEKLIRHYPKSLQAADAQFYIGKVFEDQARPYEAFTSYQKVIEKYPFSDRAGQIVKIEYDLAERIIKNPQKTGFLKDIVGSSKDVTDIFKAVIKNAPYGPYAAPSQYKIGLYLQGKSLYQEARDAFEKTVNNYPGTQWAKAAQYQIAVSDAKRSAKPEYSQAVTTAAIQQFKDFAKQYPDADLTKQARNQIVKLRDKEAENKFIVARFYEKNRHYTAAKIYYQAIVDQYADTQWASKALVHLRTIDEKTQ